MSAHRGLALLLPLALGLLTRSGLGAPPERLRVSSNSSCPSAGEVVQQLAPLLSRSQVQVGSAGRDVVGASIFDQGGRVQVTVAGEERVFEDPERTCAERARASAVFIALVVDPPLLPEVRPKPAAAPAPAAASPPAATGPHLTLELGPLLQAAPQSDAVQLPVAGGFGSRLTVGRGLGVALGAAYLLPTRLELPAADARLAWVPFDVSLRLSQRSGPVTWAGELGPELALLFASGDRVKNPRTSTRLEVGARGALSMTWGMSQHLGAFLTVFSVWRPKPYDFRVNPDVASGSTPAWWVGASLGLSLRSK